MIGVYKEKIAGVPSLIVVEESYANKPLPTVFYFHGITSAKEHNLTQGFLMAEMGFRVVLPDSMYHGERESSTIKEVTYYLFQIVLQNVKELNDMKEDLEKRGLVLDGRIGVAGTSMGGITTAAALSQYPWVKSAAILMGSPKLTTFARELVDVYAKTGKLPIPDEEVNQLYDTLPLYDLSLQAERLSDRPLLFWHGDADPVVPFAHSHSFYEYAKKLYSNPDLLRFIREEGRGHKVSRYAILETVKWFVHHL